MKGCNSSVDNDLTGVLLFAIVLVVILALGCLNLLRYFIDTRNTMRCPNRHRLWAAQKLREELLSIFQKGEESGDPENPEFRMVKYEKYRMYCKCKYCGHEWTLLMSRKL
jgi:hypothetical protein